ncbi:hypothetical protein D3C73_1484210 [compost metagenome]
MDGVIKAIVLPNALQFDFIIGENEQLIYWKTSLNHFHRIIDGLDPKLLKLD